jgi:hypothetical protein
MTSSDGTLLQLVALALPAVAILMRVFISVQQNFVATESARILGREFRFPETALVPLVVSGVVLAYSVLLRVSSPVVSPEIATLVVSLSFIAIGVRVALSRARLSESQVGKPESYLKGIGRDAASFPVVGLVLNWLLRLAGRTLAIVDSAAAALVLGTPVGGVRKFVDLREFSMCRDERRAWVEEFEPVPHSLSEASRSLRREPDDAPAFRSNGLLEDVRRRREVIPESVDSRVQTLVRETQRSLEYVPASSSRIRDLREEANEYGRTLSELESRFDEVRREVDEVYARERTSGARPRAGRS